MPKVTGLEGVVAAETNIGLVDGEKGHLVYRGYWAKDLALGYDFEAVAYLLLNGTLPNESELDSFTKALSSNRELPAHVKAIIDLLPAEMEMMSVIRTAISSMGDSFTQWPPTIDQAIRIISILPTIIAYRYHQTANTAFVAPNPSLGHVANYLYMLTGKEPNTAHVRALNAYFILTMEHGMNAGTFAARTIISTQSEIASAISGAVGAMKGPLHGGAPSEVIQMLNEIGDISNAEAWMRDVLSSGGRLMGFGHRVYKTRDPRAVALREVTSHLIGEDPWFNFAFEVENTAIRLLEEYKPGRRLYTNVEFYAAAVLSAVEMPTELFTATFTASRVVGWTSHLLEQVAINRIFRPQSIYTGEMPE
ncbi:citrate synthase/methylcitrate synthase [Paenibacillus albiflavus]|uniref:Citrate synthase n=1 Tax=Paenibacillus albiflavus TaxID=2545760 RepID=A0A4R4EEQ8_9BACL|nr:citrate synthase/methylcitrate synthase [Paenibacillus albiflavus]TCZ77723.1 citrate synthase/methylcitrate synthase [Paenibacillus albiflavus]